MQINLYIFQQKNNTANQNIPNICYITYVMLIKTYKLQKAGIKIMPAFCNL